MRRWTACALAAAAAFAVLPIVATGQSSRVSRYDS
jgi:hypothetical protein